MRTLVHTTAAIVCLAILLPSTAGARPSPPLPPDGASASAVRARILTLLNAERSAHGLTALRGGPRLSVAARSYANRMVQQKFFSHDKTGMVSRIRAAGYLRHAGTWAVGENLAWGKGSAASPDAIVRAWMASPPHRANILNGRFRQVGIGVVAGAPVAGGGGVTYVTDFGMKSR